ncbi:MAG: WecB/TagA/CpsF family glycosyltransferase [Acidocella sp.]|nr:WecB/TagA/CpsF family glycosyltransferase [Acidocella sp.]
MIDLGKRNVLGVMVDAVDYDAAVQRVMDAAESGRSFTVSALAVHGVMTGATDKEQQYRLNRFSMIVPDGQPVRWALNLLHRTKLANRVYGPELTLRVLKASADKGLPVFFYGSTPSILASLQSKLRVKFPDIQIAGSEPSKFRKLDEDERHSLADRIKASGAKVLFVGLGCPRQEVFAYEMSGLLSMPMLAVGAAFAFHAGELPQAPPELQKRGLEWLYRLAQEPKRLWKRYLLLNPYYLLLLAGQWIGLRYSTAGVAPTIEIGYG